MNVDIKISDLMIHFYTKEGMVRAVDGVDLVFNNGKITGIVGETGSGKSVLGLSILNLLASNAKKSGSIFYKDEDLLSMDEERIQNIRGKVISIIPQNPSTAFNPILKIGEHINELFYYHEKVKKKFCKEKTLDVLRKFSFLSPERIYNSYSFQLSGGMSQRALTAMGMALNPKWIIADEPTKGLDAIIRNQVYNVFKGLKADKGVSMIVITHDLMLARKLCDEIVVMYGGKVLEQGDKEEIFSSPKHPYTRGLIDAQPNRKLIPIEGMAPNLTNLPNGCRFHTRCKYVKEICRVSEPDMYSTEGSKVRCFLYDKSREFEEGI
ncbi:ABC transporter ATP-binding protein [Clostridium sp. FP1]|uniref:ABC transporter ATP-binding protein n=1 Tax=Clostridium sp. FP1 TaxID=2724076 RepID=UPI0013E92872|nr:ABC transporter ATP-binding protein [Clostridium sp. FP1]MBZ9634857.1 ABC transporter ATP-binding protein [Clostridium sp. FP1]